jgi:hypothetical protein
VYESKSRVVFGVAYVVGVVTFALAIWGGCHLVRRGHWWVFGVALYFGFIWLQWGARMKPRYMMPIAPMLFLLLWAGTTGAIAWVTRRTKGAAPDSSVHASRPLAGRVAVALVAFLCFANVLPWAIEMYVRRATDRDFYDVTRRGAYARLVDIGAFAQRHIPGDVPLWANANAHRRIAYFLTGHRVEIDELDLPTWDEWARVLEDNRHEKFTQPITFKRRFTAAQRRRRFLSVIPKEAKYFIVHVRIPQPGDEWPTWHLPFAKAGSRNEWWRLYERTPDDDWKEVHVPRADRDYVRSIPAIVHPVPGTYGESTAPID